MTESAPDLDHFTHDDAWKVGSALVARCRTKQLPVTISIWLGQQRVFHAALPGTSADNDAWVEKKANVVRRFGRSSLEVFEHYDVGSHPEFLEAFGLSRTEYAPGEGALPIRVPRQPGRRPCCLRPGGGRRPRAGALRPPHPSRLSTSTRAAFPDPSRLRRSSARPGRPRVMSPRPNGTPTCQSRHHPTSKETPNDPPHRPAVAADPLPLAGADDAGMGRRHRQRCSRARLQQRQAAARGANWAPDGTGLLLNGDGLLWRLDLEPAVALTPVPIQDLPPINNDHVVDAPTADTSTVRHRRTPLSTAPLAGGTPSRVSH